MGASQSTPDAEDSERYQSSDDVSSSDASQEREATLDHRVHSRIQAELEQLRKEEDKVRFEIESVLEKENLDRERNMAGEASDAETEGDSSAGNLKTSHSLLVDLEEVKRKVDKYQSKRDLSRFPEVEAHSKAVLECYKVKGATPLDCWQDVEAFKSSVAKLERQYLVDGLAT